VRQEVEGRERYMEVFERESKREGESMRVKEIAFLRDSRSLILSESLVWARSWAGFRTRETEEPKMARMEIVMRSSMRVKALSPDLNWCPGRQAPRAPSRDGLNLELDNDNAKIFRLFCIS